LGETGLKTMTIGKEPACNALAFARDSITSGTYNITCFEENINQTASLLQWFSIPSHHKKRPYQITTALDRLKSAYNNPLKSLKALQFHIKRQVRSTRRKTMLDTLRYMIYSMDDETLRIGRHLDNGKWKDKTLDEIALSINASLIAVKRAIGDLISKGYITSQKAFEERLDGEIRALPSIRYLTPKIFLELGIEWKKMFNLKQYKAEKRRAKEKKEERKLSNSMKDLMSNIINTTKSGLKTFAKPNKSNPLEAQSISPEEKRNLIHRAFDMYQADPSRTPSEYFKELLQTYKV
jgi:hypothetical protein